MKRLWMLGVALSALSGGVVAQPAASTGASSPPAANPASATPSPTKVAPQSVPGGVLLAADTKVSIELAEAVSSDGRKRGDKFAIRLATPIIVDGRTVAPAGATGVGEVVYAERGGGGGSPGKLVLAARYIDVGDTRVLLKAFNLGAGGDSEFRELQVASALIGVAALLIEGHNVLYPVGTRARAKVAADVTLPVIPTPSAAVTTTPAAAAPASPAPTSPSTTSPAAAASSTPSNLASQEPPK